MRNLLTRALTVVLGCLLFAVHSYAQSTQSPTFLNYTPNDGAIVYGMSANGNWALLKSGGDTYSSAQPRLINVLTNSLTDITTIGATACDVTDVTDDGNYVVGSYNGLPAYWYKKIKQWNTLEILNDWSSGTVSAVTPDGKYAVGYCTGFYGIHEDDDAPASYEFDIAPCLWDLSTGKIISTPNLPTRDMTHVNQHQNAFVDISPDGRYILGRMDFSYVAPPSLFCYVYDRTTSTYSVIGFDEHPIDDWIPKAEGLLFTEFPAMSPNGLWVTGTAYMSKATTGSAFSNEYRVAFRYNVKTKAFEVYDGEEDKDVYGASVDNEGKVYGATPTGNPLRNWYVRHNNYWIDIAQISKQHYGIDMVRATGFTNTGTPISVNGDGTVFGVMANPQGESYLMLLSEPISNACANVDLLGDYVATPAVGSVTAKMKTVKVVFGRGIKVLKGANAAALKDSKGNLVRNSATFEVDPNNSRQLNIAFRTQTLNAGETYTVEIPEGSISIKEDEVKTNKLISLSYTGRANTPITLVEASPANGSELSMIDNEVSPIILTFDSPVTLTDTAYAELYRADMAEPVCRMTVAFNGNKVAIYPSSPQYLYEGHDYTVVLCDSAITDAGGNCGNEKVTLHYKGTYVQQLDSSGSVLFYDGFDNISQSLYLWMRYEGDHNTPASVMQSLEFDADNQPWNFSIRQDDASYDYCMASHSIYTPAGKSDDWTVIPQITIPDERCYLTFKAQSYKMAKSDSLSVIIFESEENIGVLTEEIMKQFKSKGKRVFYEKLTPGTSEENLDGDWQQFSVSLADYAGKKIYIAFLNDNYNQSAIFVDDVMVGRELIYSMALKTEATLVQQTSADIAGTLTIEASDLQFSSLTLKLIDESGNVLETLTESGLNLKQGDTYKFDFVKLLPLVVGNENPFSIEVTLDERVNTTYGTIKSLAFKPTKRVVLEKMTGTTCQFCPGGILAIEEMKRVAGDQFIPVAIHTYTGDNLSAGLADYSTFLALSGAPTGRIDRLPIIASPIWQNNLEDDDDYGLLSFSNKVDHDTWLDLMSLMLSVPTTLDVTAKAYIYEQAGKLCIPVTIKNALNTNNASYGVFTVLLEDGLKGDQSNNYHSNPDPLLGEWGKGGAYGQSTVKGIVYDDVARFVIASSYNGTPNLFPSSLQAGSSYGTTVESEIPSQITNWQNAKAVVMIVDLNTGLVVNAAVTKFENGPTYIEGVDSVAEIISTEYFTLGGTLLDSPQKGVNIVRHTLSDGTIAVKKVMVK